MNWLIRVKIVEFYLNINNKPISHTLGNIGNYQYYSKICNLFEENGLIIKTKKGRNVYIKLTYKGKKLKNSLVIIKKGLENNEN